MGARQDQGKEVDGSDEPDAYQAWVPVYWLAWSPVLMTDVGTGVPQFGQSAAPEGRGVSQEGQVSDMRPRCPLAS